jgi:PAS domain S-box-containing protein
MDAAATTAAAEPRHFLSRAAQLLSSSLAFDDALSHTVAAALPTLGDFGFFDIVDGEAVRRTARAHEDDDLDALLQTTEWVRQERDDGINLCALSSGETALHVDVDDAWYQRVAQSPDHLAILRRLAFGSMVSVPVRFHDETIGALTLFMGRSRRRHSAEQVASAHDLAALAASVVANTRLVAQHARSEAALQLSQRRLRLAMAAGDLGTWDWDIASDRIAWSDGVYRLHGVAPEAFGGSVADFARIVHEDDRAHVQQQIERSLAEDVPYAVEFRVVWPRDGSIHWLATRAQVERDGSGTPLRMAGATYDVTERVRLLAAERTARDEAERARRRLELLASASALLSQSLEPTVTMRRLGEILVPAVGDWCRIDLLDASGTLVRGIAYHANPQQEALGTEAVHRLRARPDAVGSMAWCVRTGLPFTRNCSSPEDFAAAGDPALLEFARLIGMRALSITPLVARGRTLGALAVLQAESGRNFTADDEALLAEIGQRAALAIDNARLYSEAQAAREQAELANRAKDEFLAMLGHELRNPLAPIVTTLKMMAMRDDHRFEHERHLIGRQVDNLARLVDDLLDVSRIARGDVRLRRERLLIADVIARAAEIAGPLVESRRHRLRIDLAGEPLSIDGDAIRLDQVFANLLNNAARYSPEDSTIAVTAARRGSACVVTIADNGHGIEPDLLPRIFDLFVQGRQGPDRASGGLGVGLAVVKNLVGLHGGSVSAESAGPGKGSTFAVTLPIATAADAPVAAPTPSSAPEPKPAATRGQRVVVVDDNRDAAEATATFLAMVGFDVRFATDPDEGLAIVAAFQPEVAILDIGLPKVDGYALAERIRAATGGRCRLLAVTGYGLAEDRARTKAAGFEAHFVKPVDLDVLVDALRGGPGAALPFKQPI